jgi:hypothetical protein
VIKRSRSNIAETTRHARLPITSRPTPSATATASVGGITRNDIGATIASGGTFKKAGDRPPLERERKIVCGQHVTEPLRQQLRHHNRAGGPSSPAGASGFSIGGDGTTNRASRGGVLVSALPIRRG